MKKKTVLGLLGAGLVGLGSFLYQPTRDVLKAVEGRDVSVQEVLHFFGRNLDTLFQYWDEIPVTSEYREIPNTRIRETLLYERTPKKEILSHRVFDGYAMNGMSPDNFVFEKKFGEDTWRLVGIHPYRNGEWNPLEEIGREINGKPAYTTFEDEKGKHSIQVGNFRLPVGSQTKLEQVISLAKDYFSLDISDYEHKAD